MNIKISQRINKGLFYGWIMTFMAGLSIFFSAPGQTYSISTFIDAYIQEFDFSRTTISSIYSVATVASGMTIVFMGKMVDRFGQRTMMLCAGFALAMTCLFNSFISNIFMLAIGFFFLRYFGQGSLTLIPSSLVPQWFEEKRAFAISLANLGGMLANMLVPVFNIWLISTYSWQSAWRLWSILIILIFLPLVYFLVVNKPEDIELLPDNKTVSSHEALLAEMDEVEKSSWTLNQAMKCKEFWFIGIISMVHPMITTGLMFHFFSIMTLKGLDKTSISFVIGLIALPGLVMPIISNFIIDRFRSKFVITTTLIMISISMILLLFVHSPLTAAAFMLFYGLSISIQSVTTNVIWPRYFGRKYLGSIRGAATVFMVIGSALGPLPFGLSFDLFGSYQIAIIGMSIATLLCLGMSLSIRKPKKIQHS